MPKWNVYGTVQIGVTVRVEAETAEDAIEAAYDEFDGLTNYAGNGGTGKLVGVSNRNISLESDYAEPEFKEAEQE